MVRLASAVSLSGRKVISRRQQYLVYLSIKLLSHVRPRRLRVNVWGVHLQAVQGYSLETLEFGSGFENFKFLASLAIRFNHNSYRKP